MSLISAGMRAVIGRELSRSTSFPVSESDIRRWAVATYYPDRPPARYWDEKAAEAGGGGAITAPDEFNPFAWMAAPSEPAQAAAAPAVDRHNPDYYELTLAIAGPGLKNQLNGGVWVEYGAPMRPGDVIESVTSLFDYSERTGRLGEMLFTVTEDVWRNQRSEVVRRYRMTLIRY
jgi:hypothetical protein